MALTWETIYVCLILVVVILFNAFPPAFAAISIAPTIRFSARRNGRAGISQSLWTVFLHLLTAFFAVGAFDALRTRKDKLARIAAAAAQVSLIIPGWVTVQFHYSIEPDVSLETPPRRRSRCGFGSAHWRRTRALRFSSYLYLFRVFKSKTAFTVPADDSDKIKK